jgi:hypothetical protein
MDAWHFLTDHASEYGFLGPIVGIVGLLLSASGAIMFAWSRALSSWKPPADTFSPKLANMAGLLSAIGLFVVWILADQTNGPTYLRAAIWLAIASFFAFLIYLWLLTYCGRFRKRLVDPQNMPGEEVVIWGGFYIWKPLRQQVREGATVEEILAGHLYDRSKVWPPVSLSLATVITACTLICTLLCGTLALSTAAASIEVALTGKPAREIFSTLKVPGLSPAKSTSPQKVSGPE